MTLRTEIKHFAKHYGMTLTDATMLFLRYGRKPANYRTVVEIDSNAKTIKGQKYGYLTGIIYLAPADSSGYEVCASATDGCRAACLGYQGRARFTPAIVHARIRKTLRYFQDTDNFTAAMLHDCFRLMRSAARRKLIPCVRPNGTSDLPKLAWTVAEAFPWLQVYDYTKHIRPYQRTRANYHLTFSRSGENDLACIDALQNGVNVAVVFAKGKPLPATWNGYQVVNGDEHDLRFLDAKGVVVGLTSKGNSATLATDSRFIILQ